MSILHEGQLISGKYEVEAFLGEGAFAEVYRVKHRFLGRQAMKVFKLTSMTAQETVTMLGEALLLTRLAHPNIVHVFEADVAEIPQGRCSYFTMDYVAGGSLQRFWQSHGSRFVPVETTVEIIRQICRGLAVAHGEQPPIIHRDIKPQNILVGYDKNGLLVRIADFGLAKAVNPLTLAASVKGTPGFKAPEALLDPQGDSCAGDVFAIGSTLYLLLTDKLPYLPKHGSELGDPRRFNEPLEPAHYANIQVDDQLERILTKALVVDRRQRYATAGELLKDLDAWLPRTQAKKAPAGDRSAPDMAKSALGAHSAANEEEAREMVKTASQLSRHTGKLQEAADLLEKALTRWPLFRSQYEGRLKLWRKGVVG